ncbi:uncharacterized protein LOC120438317 [Oreochromis aureus]|uniref:uncharacterized protein LOC120438317 n=1 Tax=Oreochromis aureus TaxID=47969 RepID=UPI00195443E2|nr:uncharacterized protein LOC120438317 [Oreochromis aureus]
MAAGTALLCCSLLFVHVFVSADQKNITAESGQNVTLTCRAPNNKIKFLKWTKAFLWSEAVILHWDGPFDPFYQHPSFTNRMDLQDRQMKDGDVSLILNNVTINDAGTYECHVFMEKIWRWQSISIIYLSVVVPPDKHTTTPPPTSAAHPGSTSITLPPSLSPPPLSVLLPVGSVYVVVLLVLLVLLVRRCVHRKLEDGEDDITSSITYSVVKSSNHQQPPVKEARERETDSAVIYSAVRTEDVSYGQTTIRTRRPRL